MSDDGDRGGHPLDAVSRETRDRLALLITLLQKWQGVKNLVAEGSLAQAWDRHVVDSAQLLPHGAAAGDWLDLGSGGGFPGLVIAAMRDPQAGTVHLVESNARKCAFLREASRAMGLKTQVHCGRIETLAPRFESLVTTVSARALAPLPQLLRWTHKLLKNGAVGVFPKGQDWASELTEASKSWMLSASTHKSLTDPKARIVVISEAKPLGANGSSNGAM